MQVKHARGMTIVELLVVIAVIGLGVALLVPAVQSARASSRRLECANTLKQFGLAIGNYTSAYDAYPPGVMGRGFSLHVALLPYADQSALFNAINMELTVGRSRPFNRTASETTLSLLVCPSDSLVNTGMTNYAGCLGDHQSAYRANGVFANWVVGSPGIVDGTSSTVAMSEFLVGRPDAAERRRTNYKRVGAGLGLDEFTTACRQLQGMEPLTSMIKGQHWMLAQRNETLYDHTLSINDPSCVNAQGSTEVAGSTTATSDHRNGANSLFADGHVRFVRESIEVSVWRALGTRNGGEVIPSDAY